MTTVKYTFFLFLVGTSIFLSCTNNHEPLEPKVEVLESDQEFLVFGDSVFYDGVERFARSDETFYVADKSARIFRLNKNIQLLGVIENIGRGPGEFTFVSDISFSRDSLYVFSRSQAKIVVFDNKDQFIREIPIEKFGGARHMEVGQNGLIYLSTPFSDKPITIFNSNGEKIKSFGEQTADPEDFNVYRNERILALHNDKLIAASPSDPLIWVYDLEGKLLYKLNIDHPKLENRIAEIKDSYEKPSPQGGYMLVILFEDITIHNDNLYVSTVTRTENEPAPKYTLVLSYKINDNGELIYTNEYELYRQNRNKRLSGVKIGLVQENKFLLYDLIDKTIHLFEDQEI
ncbi:6-bladed beta-propeller [Gracilimonas sp.]|uniref:6-bladed beta-propeller n=1 Tax=Gracilimonas sp. TaxID=1974203 RepID=UPI0028726EA3|nr:6-bladed beta-propeller [Gracilimonas sp.]